MRILLGVVLLTTAAWAQTTAAPAEAAVYCVKLVEDLDLQGGSLPAIPRGIMWFTNRPQPYVVLDGEGVAFVLPARDLPPDNPRGLIAVRLPERRAVTGRLFEEGPDSTLVELRFALPAEDFDDASRQAFLEVTRDHYLELLNSRLPGAAWWRHRANLFAERAGGDTTMTDPMGFVPMGHFSPTNMDDTFDLFTGSRAVAENLQLDRTLPATPADTSELTRPVDSIAGITVAEYDWSQAVAGLTPALDPLAALIPADQHAVFFPSFQALIDMADQADIQGTPILQALSDPTGEAGTKQRYQQQLGLPMSDLARMLGPALIDSVALTGGDPYLATGSDVAIVFQAKDGDVLEPLIVARVAAGAAAAKDAPARQGAIDGVEFVARVSPDRAVSSFVCRLGDAVVVTNSEAQLRRLVAVSQGHSPALASQPEYAFFRSRYALDASGETALLVLSDATIRRWCGPRWRIGDSRRTRAAAALAEAQARTIESALVGETAAAGDPPAGIGQVTVSDAGARSSIYGTLAFMTPIAELDLEKVSDEEADLYGRWRDGYQQNWSGTFDPIGVRFEVASGRLAADVTVRPLIVGSDYREFVDLAKGATIAPQACDPHADALLHWAMAIDKQSSLLGEQSSMLSMMLPDVDALGWLGQAVSIYADEDPFWDELRAADDAEDFLERNWPRLPIAVHAEVANGLLLTGFLVGVRGMIEQSSPDMSIWENHTYHDEPYVSIRPSFRAVEDTRGMLGDEDAGLDEAALYYVASGDGLLVSLNRSLIERAIDRRLQRKAQRAAASATPDARDAPAATAAPAASTAGADPAAPPWLGDHLCVRLKGEGLSILDEIWSGQADADQLRAACFANLPILNEWHRLYPGEDPVAVHERLWHRRLLCPGGGTYRWNDEWQTMESTVYGHPGDKRKGPAFPPALSRILSAAAGLTFEADGLRARFELQQTP